MSETNPNSTSTGVHSAHEIVSDTEFKALARAKASRSVALLAVMFFVYFGYIGMLAMAMEEGGGPATIPISGATLGIPLGIGVIVFTWLMTGIYVTWANKSYDVEVARVRARFDSTTSSDSQ